MPHYTAWGNVCAAGYRFDKPVRVYKAVVGNANSSVETFRHTTKAKVQYSNDGANWLDLSPAFEIPVGIGNNMDEIGFNLVIAIKYYGVLMMEDGGSSYSRDLSIVQFYGKVEN